MRSANYVEETTTSIAGAGGIGEVTLTAIASIPRFSTVFGTQATTIRYVIEDTVGKKMETGIGSVASNVLTRTRPQTTWDGTTYDETAPSAVAFGASPTAGNIKIRLAATAEAQGCVLPGVNSTIAGDAAWQDYPITNSVGWDNNGSTGTLTANTEYYTCYQQLSAGLLDGLQFEVRTAVSGSMKLALYSVAHTGLPGSKILDFNILSVASTGFKTDAATGTWSPAGGFLMPSGWYYIGFISDVACGIRGFGSQGSNSLKSRTPLGRHGAYGWGNTVTVGGSYASGLPSNPAPTTMILANTFLSVPWIGLRTTP
jgi:hypothetical protein